MQVMLNVTNPLQREQTITKGEDKAKVVVIKELLERTRISCAPQFSLWCRRRWKRR